MKRLLIALLTCFLVVGVCGMEAQAQTKTTKTSTSKKKKKGKNTAAPTKPQPTEVELPYNSNDCLFAIDLSADVPYGPTTAPKGAGRIQEIMRDKNHPNLFEYEHNSVWYKLTIPYSGMLEIEITATNPKDDYDFLLYKYTDAYFSNHIIQNKVVPVAVNLSAPDSTVQNAKGPHIGMNGKGTKTTLTKKSTDGFLKSIPVRKGEVYYIVLDNLSAKGEGHTIKYSIHVDFFDPEIRFFDPVAKKYVDVDLLILEKNTDNRAIVKNPSFRGGKVKFVPKFDYTLYAKKNGYFSIYKEFNSNIFMEDTMMRFVMNRTEKGTSFPITDIYFDNGEDQLLPESDSALNSYVAMLKNHPEVNFLVKGYVQSYGVDIDNDLRLSLARAQRVKEYFIGKGIEENRITVAGMTQNEIKRAAAAALNKNQHFKEAKVELIITEIKKQ